MKLLALEDMAGKSELEIKSHIAEEYSGVYCSYDYSETTSKQKKLLADTLEEYKLLVAYESVGSWGCDSSSWFLLSKNGKFFTIEGSHCSCYGFEGQGEIEETTIEYLQSSKMYIPCGGYDESDGKNEGQIKKYIASIGRT